MVLAGPGEPKDQPPTPWLGHGSALCLGFPILHHSPQILEELSKTRHAGLVSSAGHRGPSVSVCL